MGGLGIQIFSKIADFEYANSRQVTETRGPCIGYSPAAKTHQDVLPFTAVISKT